jgi:hypothetical protein
MRARFPAIRLLACGLALAASAVLSSRADAQGVKRPAGYVTLVDAPDHEGKPGAVIHRGGQDLDVQIWTSLFAGDVVDVRGAGAVTIETAKDKRLKIDAAHSPHRVEGALPSSGRMSEIASLIGDLFHAKPVSNATNLIGRSDQPPSLRMGASVTQRVVIGAPLWVGWQDGTAPFTIEISGQTGNRNLQLRVLASTVSQTHGALLEVPSTAAGNLRLLIRDALGREASLLMLTGAAPNIPAWVDAGAPTPEFAKVAEALYLLRQNPRTFALLAGARVAGVSDYQPAAALLRQLTDGRLPK